MPNFKVELLPHQKKLLESTAPIAGIYAGRGSGKSIAISWLVAILLLQNKKAIVFSTNFKQLSLVLIPEIKSRLQHLGVEYRHDKMTNSIYVKQGVVHLFSYENADAVRGLTEIEYLICDEIALAPADLLAIAAPCLRGQFKPKIRFASSPRAGSSWNTWIKNGLATNTIEVYTASMMDNKFLSKESIDIQMQAITDETLRRQEIYGEILDDVIENCIVELTDFVIEPEGSDTAFYCGIDFARGGVDNTSIVVRNSYEIIEVVNLHHADTNEICSVYRKLDMKYHFKGTYLDATGGYDIGFYDAMKDQYDLTEVNFASKSLDPNCNNARTYIYDCLSRAIKDGFYVNTVKYKDIFDALKATSYLINGQGKKALVPKDEVKTIIGHSPDATDALALTFYGNHDPTYTKISYSQQQDFINAFFR